LLIAQPVLEGHFDQEAALAEFDRRLAAASLALPKSSAEIAVHSGRRLYDALPIHERLRRPDLETVVASVRFLVMSRFQSLDHRLVLDVLAEALKGSASPGVPATPA